MQTKILFPNVGTDFFGFCLWSIYEFKNGQIWTINTMFPQVFSLCDCGYIFDINIQRNNIRNLLQFFRQGAHFVETWEDGYSFKEIHKLVFLLTLHYKKLWQSVTFLLVQFNLVISISNNCACNKYWWRNCCKAYSHVRFSTSQPPYLCKLSRALKTNWNES